MGASDKQAGVMGVSVIVPTFQDAQAAIQTATAVLPQLGQTDELLIVDNGSAADHLARCRAFATENDSFPIKILVCSGGGSYAARNLGADQARGDILAFTDSGCVPCVGWIDAIRDYLAAAPASRVTGPIEMTYQRSLPSLVELVDARMHLNQDGYASQGWAATANMAMMRKDFLRLGGFHHQLHSGGDYELGIRAMAAGHAIGWSSGMMVRHEARSTLRELLKKRRRIRAGRAQIAALPAFNATLDKALHASRERGLQTDPRTYPPMGMLRWQMGRIAVRLLRELETRLTHHG